ncbi:MAG TPA: hypothetical protein VGD78_22840, partial [Chthoniobacterales bacterium]
MAVVGGLGRAFAVAAEELPRDWHFTGLRLPDFLALGRVRRTDLLCLWRLQAQERALRARGIHLANINGEMNLLGYWQSNGERLVPRETPASGVILHVGTDFIAQVRNDLRTVHDMHAVPRRTPDVWVPVCRYNVDPFFKEVACDPIYADPEDAAHGRLRGVVETSRRAWWVSSVQWHHIDWHRDMQRRIWDALIWWMGKIAPLAEVAVPELPLGPIEIFLRFENLENWTTQRLDDLPGSQEAEVGVNWRLPAVRITLPVGFLRHFATPTNVAERKLICACFAGIAALGGMRFDPAKRDELVQSVVRSEDARFFHLAFPQNIRQQLQSSDRLQPRFISEGEINFVCVGLAQRILRQSETGVVEGATECHKFLHAVVDDCWSHLRALLEKLHRGLVIDRALKNVEAMECDTQLWQMTASALLATHEDREDVIEAAQRREGERARAKLASRIIVEMAVCTCPASGGAAISESDCDQLLAFVDVLISAANSSDAVEHGLTPAKVQGFPNGEFYVDDAYSEAVVQPYMTEHFTQQFTAAATSYGNYYRDPGKEQARAGAEAFDPVFLKAFRAEYGISIEDFLSAHGALEKDVLRDERLVVQRTPRQIREVLKSDGLSAEVADRLFEHFSLWPRGAWDKTPKGFTAKDWYPWRFRRRLSLLARPFVRLDKGDDAPVIFAPGIVRDSIELLMVRLLHGRLPAEYFRSAAMRSWIGEATRRRGDEFEDQVAEEFRAAGLNALVRRPMTEFGADESYGNLDVLAWP